MREDKCPNCGGELISRVSFVDYCLDCETTIDASYWQTRAYVAEEHAKRSDAEIARLTATLDGDPHQTATPEQRRAWRASAIKYADRLEAEVARLTAELAAANEDAERLAGSWCYWDEREEKRCVYCGAAVDLTGHAADCPITLHRARVGGGNK